MKKVLLVFMSLIMIASFVSCAKQESLMINITDEMLLNRDFKKEVKSIIKDDCIPMVVRSGSMEPTIMCDSLIKIDPNDKDIAVKDIIAFYEGDYVVTHRVTRIDEDGNYYTKGDANNIEDGFPTTMENILGKVVLE